jgi:hypothetical protein
MTDYGVFGNIVATAGCLAAAAAAVTLSWMKRVRWQPPEEALPKVGSRVAGLIAMVFIAYIYVFGEKFGLTYLAIGSVVLLLLSKSLRGTSHSRRQRTYG